MFTLKQLRHFRAVLEHGSMHKAAESAAISQPALTASLANLESQLGSQLFKRTPKGMVPTEFGHQAGISCLSVLNSAADLQKQANEYTGLSTGKLRIGIQQGISQPVLSNFLPEFMVSYPGLSYSVIERTSEELVDALIQDYIDLAVAGYRGLQTDYDISIHHLQSLEFYPFVRSGHPLEKKQSISLSQLLVYPMVAPEPIPAHLPLYQRLQSANTGSHQIPHISCSDYAVLAKATLHTNAFMVAPRTLRETILDSWPLRPIDVPSMDMNIHVAVVERPHQYRSPAMAKFVEKLNDFLEE